MAPDGKSFITSVGTQNSMVWIHDQSGEHPTSSEEEAGRVVVSVARQTQRRRTASFSSDGKKVYYLLPIGQTNRAELWVRELATGKMERVLLSYPMDDFDVSRDGKQSVFSVSLRNPGTRASSNSGFKDDQR